MAFPFRVNSEGRVACAEDLQQHVKEELLQLLMTNLGERLFEPRIGTNVRRLLFENVDDVTGSMTKGIVSQAIENWLGHRVRLDDLGLEVEVEQSRLNVHVRYRVAGTEDARILTLQKTRD